MSNSQPYPTFNDFAELLQNNSCTENLDLVSEPTPSSNPGNNPPNIPLKVKTLETKVAGLERNVAAINKNMANMVTKQDFEKSVTELKTLIQNR